MILSSGTFIRSDVTSNENETISYPRETFPDLFYNFFCTTDGIFRDT